MNATIYTWSYCPFCIRAKATLDKHGVPYEEHVMDGRDAELDEVKRKYDHSTVPIILLDGEFIGGSNELEALARAGSLSGASAG